MEPPVMRTIGYRSNVLFMLAAAFGLLAALGRPWYAPAPVAMAEESSIGDVQGPVEGFFLRITREVSTSGGTKGWDAFTSTDTILAALAAVAVVTALGALLPAIEQPCRELLRLVTLAMLGIVVVKLVNTPDSMGLVERRQGAWIALGVTGIMASSAATLYAAPLARRKSGPSLNEYQPHLVAPPRSNAFDTPSVPPVDRY
jgi:hypothetical protein